MRFDALKAIKEKKGLRSEKDCTETRSLRYPARATVVTDPGFPGLDTDLL